MGQFILRRLMQAVGIMFLLSVLFFVLVNLVPGGPLAGYGGARRMPPEQAAILKRQLGLDKPLPVQYLVWMIGNDWMKVETSAAASGTSYGTRLGILRGDFGFSFQTRQPVLTVIGERVPNTLYLMSVTILVALLISIPAGILFSGAPIFVLRYIGDDLFLCRAGHSRLLAWLDPDHYFLRLAQEPGDR